MNRKTLTTALVSLLLLVGCGERQQRNELITINASANYPEKELVAQDFMDVEYVPLETTDDYLTQGDVQAIGNQYIVVKNWVNDGDIFLFDRKSGKKRLTAKGWAARNTPISIISSSMRSGANCWSIVRLQTRFTSMTSMAISSGASRRPMRHLSWNSSITTTRT